MLPRHLLAEDFHLVIDLGVRWKDNTDRHMSGVSLPADTWEKTWALGFLAQTFCQASFCQMCRRPPETERRNAA